jgi:hypothetical protein
MTVIPLKHYFACKCPQGHIKKEKRLEHYWIAWQMEKIKQAEFQKKAERTRQIHQLRKGRHKKMGKITKAIFVILGTLAALVLGVLAVINIPSPRFKPVTYVPIASDTRRCPEMTEGFHARRRSVGLIKGLIPQGKKHGDYFMEWASGEKELRFYPDGEHVCANYLDEVFHGVHA